MDHALRPAAPAVVGCTLPGTDYTGLVVAQGAVEVAHIPVVAVVHLAEGSLLHSYTAGAGADLDAA